MFTVAFCRFVARRWRDAAVGVVVASVSALAAGGCGNAAANTAAALLGVGIGAQALTGSNVGVKVEVYDPGGESFKLGHPLAISDVIAGAPVNTPDPVARPNVAVLRQIEAKCAPVMQDMRSTLEPLRRHAMFLQARPGAAFKNVGNDLSELVTLKQRVDAAWNRFQAALDAAAKRNNKASRATAALRLREFRQALTELAQKTLPARAVEYLGQQLGSAALQGVATAGRPQAEAQQIAGAIAEAVKAAAAAPAENAEQQINRAVEAAFAVVAKDPAAKAALDRRLGELGVAAGTPLTQAVALIPKENAAAEAAAAVPELQRQAETARRFTFGLLTSTPNVGPISNEVTQMLLTPGRVLAGIADPRKANKSRWKPFGYASVHGGPGDSNTIFYMENAAYPVLKSAKFDPNAFIEANGQLYQRAFSVIAAGLAADAGASGTGGGADGGDAGGDGTTPDPNTPPDGDAATPPDDAGNGNDDGADGGDGGAPPPDANAPVAPAAAATEPAAQPDDGGGGDGAGDGPTLRQQLAAVRKAKLTALKRIIAADKKAKQSIENGNWKADAGKAAVDEVKKALKDQADALRKAAGQATE
jgi:hypothetical protein